MPGNQLYTLFKSSFNMNRQGDTTVLDTRIYNLRQEHSVDIKPLGAWRLIPINEESSGTEVRYAGMAVSEKVGRKRKHQELTVLSVGLLDRQLL